ncbi:MAG: hypothetical protein DRJ65_02125, partial [Acidobacteria bacterium]
EGGHGEAVEVAKRPAWAKDIAHRPEGGHGEAVEVAKRPAWAHQGPRTWRRSPMRIAQFRKTMEVYIHSARRQIIGDKLKRVIRQKR